MPLPEDTGVPSSRPRRILTSRRPLPKFPTWDSVAIWACWVYGFIIGPLVIEIVIYEVIKANTPPDELEAALTFVLTWCLVIGLGLVGLGQYMQTLASRWPTAAGRLCRDSGSLIGLGGWSVGLLAGMAFPIVDKKLPDSMDPTDWVFGLAVGMPTAILGGLLIVRSAWIWWREYQCMNRPVR